MNTLNFFFYNNTQKYYITVMRITHENKNVGFNDPE